MNSLCFVKFRFQMFCLVVSVHCRVRGTGQVLCFKLHFQYSLKPESATKILSRFFVWKIFEPRPSSATRVRELFPHPHGFTCLSGLSPSLALGTNPELGRHFFQPLFASWRFRMIMLTLRCPGLSCIIHRPAARKTNLSPGACAGSLT